MAGTKSETSLEKDLQATDDTAWEGKRRSPFSTSFQFREDERTGLAALFERVFFNTPFSPDATLALQRTRYHDAIESDSQSESSAGQQESAVGHGDSKSNGEAGAKSGTTAELTLDDVSRYVLLYRGSNGIGKTRIFRQFMESAHRKEIPVYEVYYHDVEGIPFKPFLHAIRAILRDHDKGAVLQEKYRYALEGLIPELFLESDGNESIGAITPERLETEKVRLFDGITQLLLEVTTQRPLLLLVHDLHWSDVATIELLRYIGRNLQLRNQSPSPAGGALSVSADGRRPEAEFEGDEEWRSLSRLQPQTSDYLNNLLQLTADPSDEESYRSPARLMILASYRGFDDSSHYLENSIRTLGTEDFSYHGELRVLRRDEAEPFVQKAIAGVSVNGTPLEVHPEAVDAIYEESEGFPSFAHEMLRACYLEQKRKSESTIPPVWTAERVRSLLAEVKAPTVAGVAPTDALTRGGAEASDAKPGDAGQLPVSSLVSRPLQPSRRHRILSLRLRGATEAELRVLQVLAIARRPLAPEQVAQVLGALGEGAADDSQKAPVVLRELEERGLVECLPALAVGESNGGDSFFFRLWDYVDVVSATIVDTDRRALHQRIGELRRARLDERNGESVYEVFYHLYRANEPSSSVEFGLAAARWFLRSLALQKAREIYASLAELLPGKENAEKRVDNLEQQCRISLALRDTETAEKLVRTSLHDAEGELSPDRVVELLLLEAEAAGRKDPAKGLKVLSKAPKLLKDDVSRLGVRLQLQLARLRLRRQDIKRAINFCLKGRDICAKLGNIPELGDLYREMASAFYHKGDYAHAVDNYQRALNVYEQLQLKEPQVTVLDDLGHVYLERGNYFRAARYLYRSLEIRRREHDFSGLCRSYDQLGMVYLRSEDYLKTIENLNLSLSLKERVGDFAGLNPTLNTLGDLYSRLGLYEKSLEYFKRAVANSQNLGDTEGLVDAFAHLAHVYYDLGDFKQAESLTKQVEILGSEFKLRSQEANGMLLDGFLRALDRAWVEAEKQVKQAGEIYGKLGHRRREANALLEYAEIKLQRELFDESLKIVSKGQVIADELKVLDLQVRALVIKGNIYRFLKGGNIDKAREFFQKAFELSQHLGDVGILFSLFYSFAKLCHAEREFSEAANYYGKAELILQRISQNLSEDLAARFQEDHRRKIFSEDLARFRKESLGRASGAAVDLRESVALTRSTTTDRPVVVGDLKELIQRMQRLHAGLNQLHFYDSLLEDVLELSSADRGFILRVHNRKYVPVAFHGFGKTATQHPEYMVASQLAQESIRKGRPIVASGDQGEVTGAAVKKDSQLQLGYLVHRSVLAVPFMTDDRIFGAVYLDKPVAMGEFGPRDQVLLELFAQNAAVALNNRREFETAIREPLTGFYTPSYFIDRLRDTYRLYNLHGKPFAVVGYYLPNLDEILGDGRGGLGGSLARDLGEVLPSRASVCWGSPILYVLLDDIEGPVVDALAEKLRLRLATSLHEDVNMVVVPSSRQFQQGSDAYFEVRKGLLPEECDQRSLTALRTVLAGDVTLRDAKRILEKQKIEATLRKTSGNITHAARELGIHRPQLSNLLKKYSLKREVFEQES